MLMRVRIRENIYLPTEFKLDWCESPISKKDFCNKYNLKLESCDFYNDKGELIQSSEIDCEQVTVLQHPSGVAAAVVLSVISIGVAIGVSAYSINKAREQQKRAEEIAKRQKSLTNIYSYSLRGSTNEQRQNCPIPVVLGKVNATGDKAGLQYSTYSGNYQDVHQVLCFGYSGKEYDENSQLHTVKVETESGFAAVGGVIFEKDSKYEKAETNPEGYIVRVADSPIDVFDNMYCDVKEGRDGNTAYYTERIIEISQMSELKGNPDDSSVPEAFSAVAQTSPYNTTKIRVGVYAPYGYYHTDEEAIKQNASFSYTVQYRKVGNSEWTTITEQGVMNQSMYRHWIEADLTDAFNPDDPANNQYEVRAFRNDYYVDANTGYYKYDATSGQYVLKDNGNCITLSVEVIQFVTRASKTIYDKCPKPLAMFDPALTYYEYDSENDVYLITEDVAPIATKQYYLISDRQFRPIPYAGRYSLLSIQARANDRTNGWLDQIFAEIHLKCRTYNNTPENNGQPCTPSMWTIPEDGDTNIGTMNNPASLLLYVLTCPQINPRPVKYTQIDWEGLRKWWLFCNDREWTCNAFVTATMTVAELADLICAAGRAHLVMSDNKYSIYIEDKTDVITQIFTPRNAWNMVQNKSFDEPVTLLKTSFVDEDLEIEQTRYTSFALDPATGKIARDSEGNVTIKFDDAEEVLLQEDIYKMESIDIWGVTRAKQIAQLSAYRLFKGLYSVNKYTWECGLESLSCAIGDVVYLANDIFMTSLGYGRIKDVKRDNNNKIIGVYVDETVEVREGQTYGLTIRTGAGTLTQKALFAVQHKYEPTEDTIPQAGKTYYYIEDGAYIVFTGSVFAIGVTYYEQANPQYSEHTLIRVDNASSTANYLQFVEALPADTDVMAGNLFIYNDATLPGRKVIIESIEPNSDRGATITASDYIEQVYDVDIDTPIPQFKSNVNKYGTGTNIATGYNRWEGQTESEIRTLLRSVAEYYLSLSRTELVGGSWSEVMPVVTSGRYLWRRTKNYYNFGDPYGYGEPVEYLPSVNGIYLTTITDTYSSVITRQYYCLLNDGEIPSDTMYKETQDTIPDPEKTYYKYIQGTGYVAQLGIIEFESGVTYYETQEWVENPPSGWVYGKKYWTKLVDTMTYADGNTGTREGQPFEYSELNTAYTASLLSTAICDKTQFEYNPRKLTPTFTAITLTAKCAGYANPVLHWYKNGVLQSGETETTYTDAVPSTTSGSITYGFSVGYDYTYLRGGNLYTERRETDRVSFIAQPVASFANAMFIKPKMINPEYNSYFDYVTDPGTGTPGEDYFVLPIDTFNGMKLIEGDYAVAKYIYDLDTETYVRGQHPYVYNGTSWDIADDDDTIVLRTLLVGLELAGADNVLAAYKGLFEKVSAIDGAFDNLKVGHASITTQLNAEVLKTYDSLIPAGTYTGSLATDLYFQLGQLLTKMLQLGSISPNVCYTVDSDIQLVNPDRSAPIIIRDRNGDQTIANRLIHMTLENLSSGVSYWREDEIYDYFVNTFTLSANKFPSTGISGVYKGVSYNKVLKVTDANAILNYEENTNTNVAIAPGSFYTLPFKTKVVCVSGSVDKTGIQNTGVQINNTASWNAGDLYNNANITANSVYYNAAGTWKGDKAISRVLRLTNANANACNAISQSFGSSDIPYVSSVTLYKHTVEYVVPQSYEKAGTLTITGYRQAWCHNFGHPIGGMLYGAPVRIFVNGELKEEIAQVAADTHPLENDKIRSLIAFTAQALTVKGNDRISIEYWCALDDRGSNTYRIPVSYCVGAATLTMPELKFSSIAGIDSLGFYIYHSNTWENLGTNIIYVQNNDPLVLTSPIAWRSLDNLITAYISCDLSQYGVGIHFLNDVNSKVATLSDANNWAQNVFTAIQGNAFLSINYDQNSFIPVSQYTQNSEPMQYCTKGINFLTADNAVVNLDPSSATWYTGIFNVTDIIAITRSNIPSSYELVTAKKFAGIFFNDVNQVMLDLDDIVVMNLSWSKIPVSGSTIPEVLPTKTVSDIDLVIKNGSSSPIEFYSPSDHGSYAYQIGINDLFISLVCSFETNQDKARGVHVDDVLPLNDDVVFGLETNRIKKIWARELDLLTLYLTTLGTSNNPVTNAFISKLGSEVAPVSEARVTTLYVDGSQYAPPSSIPDSTIDDLFV